MPSALAASFRDPHGFVFVHEGVIYRQVNRSYRQGQLLRVHIDGVPLDLAARLLPWWTRLRLPLLLHIHGHTASQRRYQKQAAALPTKAHALNRRALLGLLDSLEDAVRALRWDAQGTGWAAYYTGLHEYTPEALAHKRQVVSDVDAILARADTPPVIILQGDHGPRSLEDGESSLRERLGILAAYHLPGGGPRPFYDAITPVNTFRLLFNRYFGAGFSVLKDESYFSTWSHPYRLVQVAPDDLGQRMATRSAR